MKETLEERSCVIILLSTVRKGTRPSWWSRGIGKQRTAISWSWQVSCRVPECMMLDFWHTYTDMQLKWNANSPRHCLRLGSIQHFYSIIPVFRCQLQVMMSSHPLFAVKNNVKGTHFLRWSLHYPQCNSWSLELMNARFGCDMLVAADVDSRN